MPNRLSFTSLGIVFFALGLLALPSSALAGFQWVAPSDNVAPQPAAPAVQTWPVSPVSHAPTMATTAPEVISPVIISGSGRPTSGPGPAPAPEVWPSPPLHTEVLSTNSNGPAATVPVVGGSPAPTVTTTSVTTLSTAPATNVVHGFAKQVPLAVALRQILPAGYGFSVDPDVDLGVLISFQGGKPWRDTLRDALEPAGLVMREQGQMVSVGRPTTTAELTPVITPIRTPQTVDVPLGSMPALAPQTPAVEEWHAERGDNLHKIIEAWTQRAHVELNWIAEYDYPLQASFSYTGNFEDAVRNLLTGFEDAHPQPVAELHTNPGLGLKVLIVQTRGNTYSD